MEVIIASHTVMPSSPTPLEFKTHNLSFLDLIAPLIYIPLIFFYENKESEPHAKISGRLRQSLSETLTTFYPLAGEIKENSFVDCNDGGAEFVEARVPARLNEFIENPKSEELKQLVARDSASHKNDVILSVKTSFFDCGGFAVGVCLSHKVGDTWSLATFMNAWAGTTRGEGSGIIHPSFNLALRFLPREVSPDSGFDQAIAKEEFATKRLVFDGGKVENMRRLLASEEVKGPSRVEVVTASIWESFIEANKANSSSSFLALEMVNLRPNIGDHAFGNCFALTSPITSSWSEEDDRRVSKLRAARKAVDDEYINNNVGKSDVRHGELFRAGDCVFSSWVGYPMYDVDFGWGKPSWVGTVTMPYMNLVVLMDSPPSKHGIEAWVNTNHHHFFG